MADKRLELQTKLETILGSKNVYFQPPESLKINYPAIVYSLDDYNSTFADNGVYLFHKRYSVTLIDKNPDSEFRDKIKGLPMCEFSRFYTKDNLNHYNFSLFY